MKITKESFHDKRGKRMKKSEIEPDMSNVHSVNRSYSMSLDECEKFLEQYKRQP